MNNEKREAIVTNNNEATSSKRTSLLTVDSGWNKDMPEAHRVTLEFRTTRGQSVCLNVADWIELKAKVDAIVLHCSERLIQDIKATEIKSLTGADGKTYLY